VRAATAFSASVRAGSAGVAPDASVIVGIADEAVVDAGKAAPPAVALSQGFGGEPPADMMSWMRQTASP